MDKIRIAILDDHQIVIDGLKLLLTTVEEFEIVLEETDGMKLLAKIPTCPFDLLLTDIMMPSLNGYELSVMMKTKFPDVKIIALSMNGDGAIIHKMIEEADIKGYLLKTANKQTLVDAIQLVANGGVYFPEEIIDELERFEQNKETKESIHLTARELEIIEYIAKDFSNKEIAQTLFISERTVETHRKNIFRKTETHSVVSLLEFARKIGLIT